MPTPVDHTVALETFLTRIQDSNLTAPLDDEYLAAEIHAHLSVATGTGDAYAAADTLISEALTKPRGTRTRPLRVALLHAIRADRG